MDKIQQLQKEIKTLEEQAGEMDVHDYEGLYKILVVAYFKQKDITELMQEVNPVQNPEMVAELAAAKDLIKAQLEEISSMDKTLAGYIEEIDACDQILSKIKNLAG